MWKTSRDHITSNPRYTYCEVRGTEGKLRWRFEYAAFRVQNNPRVYLHHLGTWAFGKILHNRPPSLGRLGGRVGMPLFPMLEWHATEVEV